MSEMIDIGKRSIVVVESILNIIKDRPSKDVKRIIVDMVYANNENKFVDVICEVKNDQLARIEKLDLDHSLMNNLKKGDFDGLTGLLKLDLSHNYLRELPEGIFDGLKKLEILDLSNNGLEDYLVGETFNKLENLWWLSLSHNELDGIPDELFLNLKNLKDLNLSYNDFEEGQVRKELFEGLSESLRVVENSNIRGGGRSKKQSIGIGD